MKRWNVVLFATLILLFVACGGTADTVSVEGAWGRVSPRSAENGAFYMQLINNSSENDTLLSAQADMCGTVELHESYMDEGGVMAMRPVEGGQIVVPSGETVELKVGGLHVMCLGIGDGFAVGQKIPVTLQFEKAGTITVEVEIREDAPEG